jgi:DNA-binding XRE family transcriptional regulator
MAEDICRKVGSRVRQLRKERDPVTTQQMLADFSACSRKHIVAIEKGKIDVGIRMLENVADGLGVPICDLFSDPKKLKKNPSD